jgi:hypothetical protein
MVVDSEGGWWTGRGTGHGQGVEGKIGGVAGCGALRQKARAVTEAVHEQQGTSLAGWSDKYSRTLSGDGARSPKA